MIRSPDKQVGKSQRAMTSLRPTLRHIYLDVLVAAAKLIYISLNKKLFIRLGGEERDLGMVSGEESIAIDHLNYT